MSFHVVLPSNSSFGLYPNNALADFRVRLAKPIILDRPYEVALEELVHPQLNYDFDRGEVDITVKEESWIEDEFKDKSEWTRVSKILEVIQVNASSREGLQTLLWYINDSLMKYHWRLIAQEKGRFEMSYLGQGRPKFVLTLHAKLAYAFGYARDPFVVTIGEDILASYPSPLLFENKQMFVYADILQPQIVGDSLVPLLRIGLPTEKGSREYVSETYIRPYYIPVARSRIEEVHIEVRTHTGDFFPFPFGATLICKLNFRPKQA